MAILDSLLKLVAVRGADGLVIASGQVPCLLEGERRIPLTMPVPDGDVIASISREVSQDGRSRGRYDSGDASYAVQIDSLDQGVRMTFRYADEPTAADPPVACGSALAPRSVERQSASGIAALLERATAMDASDILLSSNGVPRARIGGLLRPLEDQPLSEEQLLDFVRPIMCEADRAAFDLGGSCDMAFASARGTRFRLNLFKQERGVALALRPISSQVPTLEQLMLPADFRDLTSYRSGLVLMVGTAGSGKSTTLVALVEHLNRTADKHVITLEDPIEYTYRPDRCLIHQREVGRHLVDFSGGLRAALRESPDVILVGEMRDRETIAAALTAAETGHLVLSTLHSASAAMAIDRIVDIFPEHQQTQVRYQLANVLRAVVTQILLPTTKPPRRVPAIERLEVTSAVSTKIRDNRCHQIETELQRGRAEGMIPLELSLARLVERKLISDEVARGAAGDPLLLAQMVRSA